MKLLMVISAVCCALPLTARAHDVNDADIQQLKHDVRILKREVRRLQDIVSGGDYGNRTDIHIDADKRPDNTKGQWGCYLNDPIAGGVYGTGRSEAEARGKTLATCKSKGGACFENLLKCSRS